jgi:hypothetical protein
VATVPRGWQISALVCRKTYLETQQSDSIKKFDMGMTIKIAWEELELDLSNFPVSLNLRSHAELAIKLLPSDGGSDNLILDSILLKMMSNCFYPCMYSPQPVLGLPDGFFLDQKSQFWYIFGGSWNRHCCYVFYISLEYFTTMRYILWGFCSHLVYFYPLWCIVPKNLATLTRFSLEVVVPAVQKVFSYILN